jgi:hypothetical protein
MSRDNNSLKCYRDVTKQTNQLQVNNMIKNKFVAVLEASRRILNAHCVKISVLANVKHF